jgi:hypothetical protein
MFSHCGIGGAGLTGLAGLWLAGNHGISGPAGEPPGCIGESDRKSLTSPLRGAERQEETT